MSLKIKDEKHHGCEFSSSHQGEDISCPFVSGKLMHFAKKYILHWFFSLRLVLNIFLILHQVSGLCSYEIALIKRVYDYGFSLASAVQA